MEIISDKKRIGNRIVELRTMLKLSQEDLAQLSGFNRSTISKIEQGKYNASIELISRLVRPLGVELDLVEKLAKTPSQI